ncbi:DNA helicase MCM9 [Nematocida sp. AWRm80]|nr:DNA helicase MCM9 [Nematocida sp. AWRm80]
MSTANEEQSQKDTYLIDIIEEYNKDPKALLERLKCLNDFPGTQLSEVPLAFDLAGFPTSVNYGHLVSVYGTVTKLGLVKFKSDKNKRIDYQEIRIQERSTSYLPQSVVVYLEGPLINTCRPGELLRVTGTVGLKYNKIRVGYRIDCEYIISAISITKEEEEKETSIFPLPSDEYLALLEILSHYAPSLAGSFECKLAVLLCTIGGQEKKEEPSENSSANTPEQLYKDIQAKTRVCSHILITGASGSGKTELLHFASRTVHPSVSAIGSGCSSAGLTACAIRENNDWVIEPGAMPQADGGICCIDEFTTLKKEDKSSILEAMEQQSLTIAKAGILMRLNTQCTIIAAARHRCKEKDDILPSLKLTPPLISRFDLILPLDNHSLSTVLVTNTIIDRSSYALDILYIKNLISLRKSIQVDLSDECKRIISKYYEAQKRSSMTTVRVLESHIRLTQAYTRLMNRTVSTESDALLIALLLNSSLSTHTLWTHNLNVLLSSKTLLEQAIQHAKEDLLS